MSSSFRIIPYLVLIIIVVAVGRLSYLLFNNVIFDFYVILDSIFSIVFVETYESIVKGKQARFLKKIFSTYVSSEVLKEILSNPERLKLGGEKREITVLFADIRGFTSISERLNPEELVKLLNIYMSKMTDIVFDNRGMLDKYIGDAIMAIWNAPIEIEEHRKLAIMAAYRMLKELENVNKILKQQKLPEISIGIGINTGLAVVGNMGSDKKFEYTAIGDTVNLASRLEGLNKIYFKNKTGVLISESTVKNVGTLPFYLIEIDMVIVKGKSKPVSIFSIVENENIKITYEKGLKLYREGKFNEALKIFEKINYLPAEVMKERCLELIQHPPLKWEGIYIAKTK